MKKEAKKLMRVGVPAKKARSIKEKDTLMRRKYEKPILSAAENFDNKEHMYELLFCGDDLPASIVGLEIPADKTFTIHDDHNNLVDILAWQYTIIRLSERCLEHGVPTTRSVYDSRRDESKKRLFRTPMIDTKKSKKRKSE